MAELARNPVADRLWEALKASMEAWENLELEVGHRLERDSVWEPDLKALHDAAINADAEFQAALAKALAGLGRKGLGL